MLSREQIIEMVNELGWSNNQYWISTGAGLVMHGVKNKTRDIDIGCTTELMQQLVACEAGHLFEKCGQRAMTISDEIEVFENWNVDAVVLIEGLPVATLDCIKKQKLRLGREKDLLDVAAIDDFLAKNK